MIGLELVRCLAKMPYAEHGRKLVKPAFFQRLHEEIFDGSQSYSVG
jgi:hypothetical protein